MSRGFKGQGTRQLADGIGNWVAAYNSRGGRNFRA